MSTTPLTLSLVPLGGLFVSALGNLCQRVSPTRITRLFNQRGQPSIWSRDAAASESIRLVLPPGTNF